jgi:glutaredoxin 3
MKAEIYTKLNCPYCTKAKELLNDKGIEYHEYLISPGFGEKGHKNQSYVTRDDLLQKLPTAKTVPQIWLDEQHIGGYTDLVEFLAKNN